MKSIVRVASLALLMVLILCTLGCKQKEVDSYTPVSGLDLETKVELTIAIPYETDKGLNAVANAFMDRYPNVTVRLEYVEDYSSNALNMIKGKQVDMILQRGLDYTSTTVTDPVSGVEKTETSDDWYYDFLGDTEIDLSNTTEDVMGNYRLSQTLEDGTEINRLYAVPLGGEVRGMFVNVSLLKHYGLEIPTNFEEFENCCKVLRENGLIPIQANPSSAGTNMGLAQMVTPVVNDAAKLDLFRNADANVGDLFVPTLEKLYSLTVNRYYDYKTLEEMGGKMNASEYWEARSFLGLKETSDFGVVVPENGFGYCAFWPYLSSTASYVESLIEKYSLPTEFKFILSPMNDADENSKIYFTPYYGIVGSKQSANLIWIREFVNFLFKEENITLYAETDGIIPNISTAREYMAEKYSVDAATDCTICGQILFRPDYNGYTPVSSGIQSFVKCNAQKYMIDLDKDEAGNIGYQTDKNGTFLYIVDGNKKTKIYEPYIGPEDPAKPGFAFVAFDYHLNAFNKGFDKYRSQQ